MARETIRVGEMKCCASHKTSASVTPTNYEEISRISRLSIAHPCEFESQLLSNFTFVASQWDKNFQFNFRTTKIVAKIDHKMQLETMMIRVRLWNEKYFLCSFLRFLTFARGRRVSSLSNGGKKKSDWSDLLTGYRLHINLENWSFFSHLFFQLHVDSLDLFCNQSKTIRRSKNI